MNRILRYTLLFAVSFFLWTGCSTTRRLGEDDLLYTGVRRMKVESTVGEKIPGNVGSAVRAPLNVRPNNPLYSPYIRTPFPIGLWAYNAFYTERQTGFQAWLYRRFAKKPVLISDVKPELRVEMVKDILDNHGYFRSTAEYELVHQRNPKKRRVNYFIGVPKPWTYSNIAFPRIQDPVTMRIDSLKDETLLHVGERYDLDTLIAERIRITNHLRDEDYYYFRPDYLEYQADTIAEPFKVDLRMIMIDGIPAQALQPYKIGRINMSFTNPTGGEPDSMYYDGIKIDYQKPLRIRPKILRKSITIRPGGSSSISGINTTLFNMTKLGIFRYVNLNVTPLDSLKPGDSIDMNIAAAFDMPLEADLEINMASKSNSFIGPGLVFGVKHRNIFHGGEVLSAGFTGSYEWQTGNTRQEANSTPINSYEVGFTTSLVIPRLVPQFLPLIRRYSAHSTFQLGANLLSRPKFFKMMSFNASAVYDFQSSPQSYHSITLFRLVYNRLLSTTAEFDRIMEENPVLALSFANQFIPSIGYTYTLDRRYGHGGRHGLVWQTSVISAGNIFSVVYDIFGATDHPKKLFGNPFSQFIKGMSELKNFWGVGENNTIATRFFIGAGYAYGNSKVLPYSEQFNIGGANSIRAFTIRSIGPGSFHNTTGSRFGYYDQTGDFKLEANVEYRFGILGSLRGAVFLDAGNVWLLQKDPSRPGGELNFRKMWNQIAVGTGAGLRYDLTFVVVRFDVGIGIHLPFNAEGQSGYYNIPSFKDGLGYHLAIGYPF